ncbi:asparagine synthase-related protein [Acidobacteriota bacterium]
MGGWVAILGNSYRFDTLKERFEKTFRCEGVPSLRYEVHDLEADIKLLSWAWNRSSIQDIQIQRFGNFILVLCGVVTGFDDATPDAFETGEYLSVIFRLWHSHRRQGIEKIDGSFSLLIHDLERNQTYIYTDRFASRSVWIGEDRGRKIVGNFPSSIAVFMERGPQIDPAGLWSLAHTGRQIGPQGIYTNIKSMMAGEEAALLPGHNTKIIKWIHRIYSPDRSPSAFEWGSQIAKALVKSGNLCKSVSANPHLFLSGGLDSRIVAAALGSPLKTVTIYTKPNAETRMAAKTADILDLEIIKVKRSLNWYLNTLDASALISSGSYYNTHSHFIVPIQSICEKVSTSEFLLGDLMENFNKHYFELPNDQKFEFKSENLERYLFTLVPYTLHNKNRIGKLFNQDVREMLRQNYLSALRSYADSNMNVSENDADKFDTFLRWANVGVTPTYNMISSIWPFAGERNILFNNDLNKLSLRIPAEVRGAGILHKWILYNLSKGLAFLPDANTFIPPLFPRKLANFAKHMRPGIGKLRRSLVKKFAMRGASNEAILNTSGSWLLLHELYRKNEQYAQQIENLISSDLVFPSEIFNMAEIKDVWKNYRNGDVQLHSEIEFLRSFGSLQKKVPCTDISS